MAYVMSWHGLAFCVVTFILGLVNTLKDEPLRVYITSRNYTWFEARNLCTLFEVESTHVQINGLTVTSRLMWTHGTATFLPWVEYLGCFELQKERIKEAKSVIVKEGTQLSDCLLYCQGFKFIGLQQRKCICLDNIEWNSHFIRSPCNIYPVKCRGDPDTFCGKQGVPKDTCFFSVYKTVNVTERVDDGNCLAVDNNNDSFNYVALNCSTTAFQICMKDSVYSNKFYQQNTSIGTWIDSFKLCQKSYMLARYSLVYNEAQFSATGTYWLSNTRRWIQGTSTNPEFCIAARLKKDGSLKRFPLRCERKLPGLCVSREWMTTYVPSENTFSTAITEATQYLHATNGYKRTPSDDQARIDKVLLISVIAATGFIILVATVIVIICIRRTSTRTERQPTPVSQNEVLYENESNTLSRNQTANDTTDHMHYQSLNQNRNPIDSNYDILHNAEVDVTSDRQQQHDINETAEQRKMEPDYQEIEDVSI